MKIFKLSLILWLCYLNNQVPASQLEEPLAAAVRSALNRAISNNTPPIPVFSKAEEENYYQRWLMANSSKLSAKIPSKFGREELLQTIWYESTRAGLEVSMVLALIEVESAFRKFAISVSGARGYMQVMPFWLDLIGTKETGNLFHMQTNIRFGCVILRHYLDLEKGDLSLALGRYNGSRGKSAYPNLVFAAQKNWLSPN